MEQFIKDILSSEQAFWVMYYFLKEHYNLSAGTFDVSNILSACEPIEFDERGYFDGKIIGNRRLAPTDNGMVGFWNEAIERFRIDGMPPAKELK